MYKGGSVKEKDKLWNILLKIVFTLGALLAGAHGFIGLDLKAENANQHNQMKQEIGQKIDQREYERDQEQLCEQLRRLENGQSQILGLLLNKKSNHQEKN